MVAGLSYRHQADTISTCIDTTAFTSKTEQDEYLNRIKELSQVYDEKLHS